MRLTANLARNYRHAIQRMIAAGSVWHTESIPGGHSVRLQLTPGASFLECFKRSLQPEVEFLLCNLAKLRLRIVDVVNVHTLELHISKRLFQLVLQIPGRHAVTTTCEILKIRYAGFHKRFFNVATNVSRRRAVKW